MTSLIDSNRFKVAYAGLAALDTMLAGSRSQWAHRVRFAVKPMLMPTLAASLATAPGRSTLRTPVLAAQAAGWIGDVALLSERRKPFLIGTGGFALGHGAYVAGFAALRTRRTRLVDETPARALAGLWAATAPVMAISAFRRDRALALPVAAYSAALTSMVISATRLDPSVPGRRSAAAGSLLFLASDSMLGLRKFVLADPPPALESAVMATYTSGQFLLAESAARG